MIPFDSHLFSRFASMRILVIGDIILDHYIFGEVGRISPEAPVPVLTAETHKYVLGGAANVALNIKAFKGQVELIGRIGCDDAGNRIAELLKTNGIAFDTTFQQAAINTIFKTRIIARNQQICRIDHEQEGTHYALEKKSLKSCLLKKIEQCDSIIISDYAKGVLTPELVRAILKKAADHKVPVCIDPKPAHDLPLKKAYLLTPNRNEALQMAGLAVDHKQKLFPIELVCQKIWKKYQPHFLVITLGKEGMIISTEGKVVYHIPTYARDVFDVSGAGDTVIASLTLALAGGASIDEAAHFANLAAGVVISKIGTATATPEELLAYHAEYVAH
jgi:rfaE bifunctional protein kinase chain/domain